MEDFDDDFGELYADVEFHTTSAADSVPDFARLYIEPEEDDATDETKNQDTKLKEDFASDAVKVEAECGELKRSGGEVSEPNDDLVGSDSEDDLNIVLNDEDCPSFPVGSGRNEGVVRGVGFDEDDSDEAIGVADGSNLGKNGKCGDQLADGAELVSSNGLGVHNRSGLNGGFKSQFFHHKYVRRGSALANNTKVNKHMGPVSYLSSFTKGGRNGNSPIQKQVSSSSHVAHLRAATNQMNQMIVQCGYGSYLPWHWSIFDVDIDTLEEKPWRTPGVDITDYFNFGFDENTWKHYCVSLEQHGEAFMQTGSAVNKSPKNNLDAMKEQTEQAVSGSSLSPSLGCELPQGRAIQVEESMFERQSSMDVRRPRLRDSDVVIQIKVFESSDGHSGSDNSNVRGSSEEGGFCAGNKINIPGSVSEHDNELSQEPSEDVKNSGDSSTEERKDPVAGVDKNERQDQMDKRSEDNAEASEDELKAEEGIDLGTCTIESQLSFGDQDLSLTSYSDSESENSVNADNEIRQSQRRQLEKSTTDLKESAPSDCTIPKNNRFNRKEENMDYYSRKRGPIRQEWRPLCRSHDPGSKLHKFSERYEVFSKPMSGARELSLLDHEFMNCGRKNVQLQDYYGGHKRRDISCYEETEQSYHYDDGKVVDDMVHTRYWYREDHDSFREHTNRNLRRDWDEKDDDFENRIVKNDDDREQNWYHADGGYSADEMSPVSYRESRKFMSKHWSFPAKERNIQRRRHEMPYLRDRNSDKDNWFNECGRDFIDESHTTSIEREVESLDSKYEHQFLEPKRSVRRARHHVRPSLELNTLWSGRIEDECQEYTSHQTSGLSYRREFYPDSQKNCVYDRGVSEYLRHHGRRKHTRDGRGSDWYSNNIDDASEDEDFTFDPEKECDLGGRRYSSPSEVLDWIGDDVILRHHDTFHADEDTLFYEETSWHKGTYARYESLHDEMETDDIQLQHDYLHMPRRGSDGCIKRHYKIARRDKHGQAKCRNSMDFVKGDGKFHGRSSRTRSLMCGGKIENLDLGIAKKQTTMGLYKTHNEKATKFESIHNGRKRLHSILAKEHKGLEAEEGKIVTEEPCMVASVHRKDPPEGEVLTGSKRKRMLHNENNSDRDDNKGVYDNQRILETLAKMEKRRERFKEPIALIKEEKSLKPDDGLIVGTDETNQIRPLRKRRWGG